MFLPLINFDPLLIKEKAKRHSTHFLFYIFAHIFYRKDLAFEKD